MPQLDSSGDSPTWAADSSFGWSAFRFRSWPRDNATEEVWAALDRSVAAQLGRFEHIFSDFGLEATVVRATHPERL
jgi:hypothetical protein